jgi:hypothetical protein
MVPAKVTKPPTIMIGVILSFRVSAEMITPKNGRRYIDTDAWLTSSRFKRIAHTTMANPQLNTLNTRTANQVLGP